MPFTRVGRYVVGPKLAAGGMATVYVGWLDGAGGFQRIVAIKRMLPRFASDQNFVAMFLDEARLASRIYHPNVVATLDVLVDDEGPCIVMELVRGVPLSQLQTAAARAREPVPIPIAVGILSGALAGLHAAHEVQDRRGRPLGIVHRDVSPQNFLVGIDGVARVMDFGIAKASQQLHVSVEGMVMGKIPYMAPEQLRGSSADLDRRGDVYAAGVVLWGLLAGRPMFHHADAAEMVRRVLAGDAPPIQAVRDDVSDALSTVVATATAFDRDARFPSALAFARALEAAVPRVASSHDIAAWVERFGAARLEEAARCIGELERTGITDLATVRALAGEAAEPPTRTTATRAGVQGDASASDATMAGTSVLGAEARGPRRRTWALIAAASALAIGSVLWLGARARPVVAADASPPSEAAAPTVAPQEQRPVDEPAAPASHEPAPAAAAPPPSISTDATAAPARSGSRKPAPRAPAPATAATQKPQAAEKTAPNPGDPGEMYVPKDF